MRAGVTLPTGDEERGLGNGRTTWAGLLIGQYEGERWIFLSHLGYRRNRNDAGRSRIDPRDLGRRALQGDREPQAADRRRAHDAIPIRHRIRRCARWSSGFIWSVTKDIDLDAGIRRGNDPAIDKAVMAGVTLRW